MAVVVKCTFLHVEVDDTMVGIRRRCTSQPPLRVNAANLAQCPGPLYVSDDGSEVWRRAADLDGAAHRGESAARPEDALVVLGDAMCPTLSIGSDSSSSDERAARPAGKGRKDARSFTSLSGLSTSCSESGEAYDTALTVRAEQPPQSEAEWTTVMMRNLPTTYTSEDVCALLDREGFRGRFNFLYLPRDFRNGNSSGFAFVNLETPADARDFRAHFSRFRQWGVPTTKACNVSWANLDQQGLEANIERYRNSSVMHKSVPDEFRPVLLEGGTQVEFPAPTKRIWPPHASFGTRAHRGHGRR